MLNIKGLRPELLPPEEVFAGVPAPFRLRIHNSKRWLPSFLVRADCGEGGGVTIPLLYRSDTVIRDMALSFPRRGHAAVRHITVSSPFPVNFFTRYWIFPVETSFVVFPQLAEGQLYGDGREALQAGVSARHERGADGELERINVYSGGEPLKMIHWKLSARGDDLFVKEFGRHAATPLVICLDMLPGMTLEERISRAAWLVRRWVRERPVGLKLDSRTIPPAVGHHHGLKLLTELALYDLD